MLDGPGGPGRILVDSLGIAGAEKEFGSGFIIAIFEKGVLTMAKSIDLSLPSVNGIVKTAIALVVILFVVRMTPDTWGIKKWFMAA